MSNVTPQDGQPSTDEKLFEELPISGSMQVILLGLIVFIAMFFGDDILALL